MNDVRELISRWIQDISNYSFNEESINYMYDAYDNVISSMDIPESKLFLLESIKKSLKYYITHIIDIRDIDYVGKSAKFVTDIVSVYTDCGRCDYVLELPMIALYIKLKLNSDGVSENQHIYNSILKFLSEYRDNTSDDRCLLTIWHRLSELGYIRKSESSHYVRLLKHNVYSTAFDILGDRGWNGSASNRDDDLSTIEARRNSIESLRYRLGIRVQSILDTNKNDAYANVTVYGLLNFINCTEYTNIVPRDNNTNCPAIGDNLSTDNSCAAIAAMLSTDKDYAAIDIIRSTYSLYYDLLLNILNDMNFDYWPLTYDKLESLLVTSTNILSKTKSYDVYLICILILEMMKRVSNYGDMNKLNKYDERIHEMNYDSINYTNNPAELKIVLNTIECEINKLSYGNRNRLSNWRSTGTRDKSFLESCGVELSHLNSVAGFLTEGFQVIPHANTDRNLADNDSIGVCIMNIDDSNVYQECQMLDKIAQIARDNKDEQSILNNISITNDIISELSQSTQTTQIIESIELLRRSISSNRLTLAKLGKCRPRQYNTAHGSYISRTDNNTIVVKI